MVSNYADKAAMMRFTMLCLNSLAESYLVPRVSVQVCN